MLTVTNFLLGIITGQLFAIIYLLGRRPIASTIDDQHQQPFAMTNYCTWKHENGRWQVIENRCQTGFVCGDPPSRAPGYQNEIVRKPAVSGR